MSTETPMMKQYREARQSLEDDTLLLFRLGDFYEMFENDAEQGAALLGITLTKRHDMPMAGIPSHAAESYLSKLLAQGKKVAICDQLEPPRPHGLPFYQDQERAENDCVKPPAADPPEQSRG